MVSVSARSRLVLPLDVPDLASAAGLIEQLSAEAGVFKVGLELFTAAGPSAVERVHQAGSACFLDLKLHDIPKTMASAARAAAGPHALRASAEAVRGSETQLLAVTVLTSLDAAELAAIGLSGTPTEAVTRLARLATDAGIDGLVCSAQECAALRQVLGPKPLLVVPGIRPAGAALDDQRRTATPTQALADGADLLVVGRPIRDANDPIAAARAIVREIERAGSV